MTGAGLFAIASSIAIHSGSWLFGGVFAALCLVTWFTEMTKT